MMYAIIITWTVTGYATKLIVDDKGRSAMNMWKMTEVSPWEIMTWFR